jgi:hypothetical protein
MTTPVVPIPEGATVGAPASAPESQPNPAPQTNVVPIPEGATGPGVLHAKTLNPQPKTSSQPPEGSNVEEFITQLPVDIAQDLAGAGKGIFKFARDFFSDKENGDYDSDSPIGKMLDSVWNSSVQAKNRMIQSAKAGDWLGVGQHAAGVLPIANNVDAAMTNYQKDPTHENLAHVITSAIPAFVPSMIRKVGGPAEAVEGTEAAEGAEEGASATPKPGLVKKVLKGKSVEQEPAQTALKNAAGTDEESLQETLTKPIAENQAKADSLYDEMDKTGVDVKNLTQKLRNTERKLTQLTDTPEDQALETKLINSREGLIQKIKDSGVSEDQINEADTQFQKTKALSDIRSRIFKNPSVVEGDVAHGTPETVNVDSTIKALKKLQNTKYGDRVEQAFGKEGANQLFDKLYEAQRMGAHALKVQNVAKWIGKIVGAGTVLAGTEKVLGAVKSNE